MEVLNSIMQWIVAPVAAFVWILHNKVQLMMTEVAVIKATTAAYKEAHDREFKEVKENFKEVMAKLTSIEEALRK